MNKILLFAGGFGMLILYFEQHFIVCKSPLMSFHPILIFRFYTPWKHQKIKDFLGFSGGGKWDHWPGMGYSQSCYYRKQIIHSKLIYEFPFWYLHWPEMWRDYLTLFEINICIWLQILGSTVDFYFEMGESRPRYSMVTIVI